MVFAIYAGAVSAISRLRCLVPLLLAATAGIAALTGRLMGQFVL